ncbi:MAG: [FeFe] hydrogenase, group A, partial [Pseudomonadota bacterium]
QTHSPRATRARKTIIELLLSSHPNDCLYCVRSNNCDLNKLAREYGVEQRNYPGEEKGKPLDVSSLSIVRDPDKCILCGKCIRICEEVQSVSALDFIQRGSQTMVGPAFAEGLNISSCINCGQCILVCPTGALYEKDSIKDVMAAIQDPSKHVVVQHAPSVSVTLAEEFGMRPGMDIAGKMTAALRQIGFDKVFDTSYSADLTIMEEGTELVSRLQKGGKMPMFSSCSPGWVKFVEEFYPEFIENLSTCKSPQQMLGAVVKSYYAEKNNLDPKSIYSVAVMPCTAKKFEAGRPEMGHENLADLDAVLTTRELANMIRLHGIDLNTMPPESADLPFGSRSTAGKLFGVSGGVMEAALRSAHYLVTGKDLKELKFQAIRGLDGIKKAEVKIADITLKVVAVSGLGNARKVLDAIKEGREEYHFVEVMTCPGGCINGGGQPIGANPEAIRARMQALYNIDATEPLRQSHENQAILQLYKEFLGRPASHLSHELLHTKYKRREVIR